MGEVDGKLARHLMGISWEFSMGRSEKLLELTIYITFYNNILLILRFCRGSEVRYGYA